jgi:hypothetical protein
MGQTFNDKNLCPYGKYLENASTRAFLCTKDGKACMFSRYCRNERCFKMLYTSLQCPLKK